MTVAGQICRDVSCVIFFLGILGILGLLGILVILVKTILVNLECHWQSELVGERCVVRLVVFEQCFLHELLEVDGID